MNVTYDCNLIRYIYLMTLVEVPKRYLNRHEINFQINFQTEPFLKKEG